MKANWQSPSLLYIFFTLQHNIQCSYYTQIWSVFHVYRNCRVHEQCWVCMECGSLSWSLSHLVKFHCCWTWQITISGKLWSEQCWVPCSYEELSACRELHGVHIWQNGTRCKDGVKGLWCHSHLVWFVFEDSIPTCTCFHSETFLFCDLFLLSFFVLLLRENRAGRRGRGEDAWSIKPDNNIELFLLT